MRKALVQALVDSIVAEAESDEPEPRPCARSTRSTATTSAAASGFRVERLVFRAARRPARRPGGARARGAPAPSPARSPPRRARAPRRRARSSRSPTRCCRLRSCASTWAPTSWTRLLAAPAERLERAARRAPRGASCCASRSGAAPSTPRPSRRWPPQVAAEWRRRAGRPRAARVPRLPARRGRRRGRPGRAALRALAAPRAGARRSALPAAAAAHQRSQSFSTWRVEGAEVRAIWSVPRSRSDAALARADGLRSTTSARILADAPRRAPSRVRRGGARAADPPRPLRARPGPPARRARFRCAPSEGAGRSNSGAFFDLAPSHVHFARVVAAGEPPSGAPLQRDPRARRSCSPRRARRGPAGRPASSATSRLGIEHILVGYDHLAFLLSLILLGGGLRELVGVVTGFTLGHSVTLSLAALGWVQVDGALVEALIGFSIALVAAENLAVRGARAPDAGARRRGGGARGPRRTRRRRLAARRAAGDDAARARALQRLLPGPRRGAGREPALPPGDHAALRPRARLRLRERAGGDRPARGAGCSRASSASTSASSSASSRSCSRSLALGWLAQRLFAERQRGIAADGLSSALCALGLFWFLARAYG